MTTFVTGGTGFLGGYVVARLLSAGEPVIALVRAKTDDAARSRLWRSLQLHTTAHTLTEHLRTGRLSFVLGDICRERLGLGAHGYEALVHATDRVVHVAASLNRRSASVCFNVNLRGGLTVLNFVRDVAEQGRLLRYLHVSTAAVAGHIRGQTVGEDKGLDWGRSDWDPYARTKKFGEHMLSELLGEASTVVVRPSIVMGDSRFPQTTQFDMVRAFVGLAQLPVLPFVPTARLDIVPADFVADAICALTLKDAPKHQVYNLTAGLTSPTFSTITRRLAQELGSRRPLFVPRAGRLCAAGVRAISNMRHKRLASARAGAALFDAFWPYLDWDVVFDNTRVVQETGLRPACFTDYCAGLFRFAQRGRFRYDYSPTPPGLANWSRAEGEGVASCSGDAEDAGEGKPRPYSGDSSRAHSITRSNR